MSPKPKLFSENPIMEYHFLLTIDSRMKCLSEQFLAIFHNTKTVFERAFRRLLVVEGIRACRNVVSRNVVQETHGGGNVVFSTLQCHQIFMSFEKSK